MAGTLRQQVLVAVMSYGRAVSCGALLVLGFFQYRLSREPWPEALRPVLVANSSSLPAGLRPRPSPGPASPPSTGPASQERPAQGGNASSELAAQVAEALRSSPPSREPRAVRRGATAIRVRARHRNIGHNFHETVQWCIWRTLEDPAIAVWVTDQVDDMASWYGKLLSMVAAHLGIRLVGSMGEAKHMGVKPVDVRSLWNERSGFMDKFFVRHTCRPPHLVGDCTVCKKNSTQMRRVLDVVRGAAWRHLAGTPDPPRAWVEAAAGTTWSVLYNRGDADRRRLLDWERIACHFDKVMQSFAISFTEQIRILSKARLFVAPIGAHFTNVVFMSPLATVIDIQAGEQNSWQMMFGTCANVDRYETPMAGARRAYSGAKRVRSHTMDDDIVMDDKLAYTVCSMMGVGADACVCSGGHGPP